MASASRGNLIIVNTDTGESVPPFDYGDGAAYDYSRNASAPALRKFPVKIKGILLSEVVGDATLKIQDGGNDAVGIDAIRIVNLTANDNMNSSHYFQFDTPIFSPNGIIIEEITNCSAQLIIEETKR